MDLEDLFKGRRHGHGGDHGHDRYRGHDDHHHDDHRGGDGYRRDGYGNGYGDHHAMKAEMLRKLMANKPLLIGLGVGALLLLVLAAWLAVVLIGAVSQTGLKGVAEMFDVQGILKRLWEGAPKG